MTHVVIIMGTITQALMHSPGLLTSLIRAKKTWNIFGQLAIDSSYYKIGRLLLLVLPMGTILSRFYPIPILINSSKIRLNIFIPSPSRSSK